MFGKKDNEKKPKSKARKIIDWVVTGVFATLIVGVGTVFVLNRFSKNQNVLGAAYQKVLTDSMSPVYKVNDIIVVKKTDPQKIYTWVNEGKDVDVSFRVKDIVEPVSLINTFKNSDVSMTHRILTAEYSEAPLVDEITGVTYHYTFVTHGINTQSEWCKSASGYNDCTNQTQKFHENALIGKVERKSHLLTFATSVWGLLILLLVPCMYLITASVFDICKALDKTEENPEPGEVSEEGKRVIGSKDDPLAGLSDKEKEKLKKQMLDELLGKKGDHK